VFVAEHPYIRQIARKMHVPKMDQMTDSELMNEAIKIARHLRAHGSFSVDTTETKTAITLGMCIGVGICFYPTRWSMLTPGESRKAMGVYKLPGETIKDASIRRALDLMGECAASVRIKKFGDDHLADAYIQALARGKLLK
jgi:hypothetical protein